MALVLLVGASGTARPESVKREDWVSLGDNAGFALTSRQGDTIGAELWVRDHGAWFRGRVENPVTMTRVSR